MTGNADFLTAPAPSTPATPTAAKGQAAKVTPAGQPASKPTPAILARLHRSHAAKGETRIVFGLTPDRTAAITVTLEQCHRVARDGSLVAPELAAVAPVTGDTPRLRRVRDGRGVGHGVTIPAPTAGKVQAAKVTWAAVVGAGLDAPVTLSLTGEGQTWRTAPTASVTLSTGVILSIAVSVRVPKAGDAWNVSTARIFAGGKLPDSDAETLALAALDAGEAGESAIVSAAKVLTGETPVKATRAAGKRAAVTTAKRANR